MQILENLLTVMWALRVLILLAALAVLGGFHAAAVLDRRRLRARVEHLETGQRRLIAQLVNRRYGRRRPIIAGRVVGQ